MKIFSETIEYRLTHANQYFKALHIDGHVAGFVNGTCTSGSSITHETMSHHDPEGRYLVIHSVSVEPKHRRQQYGVNMLRKYVLDMVTFHHELDGVLLLTKGYLLSFYTAAGFEVVGQSSVVHGKVQHESFLNVFK